MFDMFAGGALGRMTIFALNIMPYISASIIMQLMTAVSPQLEALKKEGESGRKKINQYTRYGTVLLAAFQAYGIAVGLEGMTRRRGLGGDRSGPVLPHRHGHHPGRRHHVPDVAGRADHRARRRQRHLADHLRRHRRGTCRARWPATLELGRTGALSAVVIMASCCMAVGVIAFIVFMERAQRRIIVQYPKRQVGNRMFGGENSHLPLKLNTSGVIPPIFACSLLLMPVTIASFSGGQGPGWLTTVTALLGHGQPLYMVLYVGADRLLRFFYTAVVFNPAETADNLRKHGGFVPGIRPGKNTADYLDYVLTRSTVVGAIYLAAGLPAAGVPDLAVRGAVLFRRHQPADRRHRDHGHGRADPVAPAGAPVRRPDQEGASCEGRRG